MAYRPHLLEVNVHDAFGEFRYEWVAAVEVFAFPAPAETREHVECEPDVFDCCYPGEGLAFGHVSVEDDHGGDVKGDGGSEEGDVGEANELVVHDYCVVRRDDGWISS
jgi:hypothetical protein